MGGLSLRFELNVSLGRSERIVWYLCEFCFMWIWLNFDCPRMSLRLVDFESKCFSGGMF